MNALKYYIISHRDAARLGLTGYRQGTPEKGYVVHSGDFVGATEDFLERAQLVSEQEALNFIKTLKHE